ncbi:MAG: hypothetical protein ACXWBQ_05190 [Usitatibacter sp.]
MSRFLFFLLLLATVGLGVHIFLTSTEAAPDFSAREKNRDEVRIVAVTPPTVAARAAEETRRNAQSLVGAACVELSGIASADIARAHDTFASLQLGDRLAERRVEEITRHWVFIPPAGDRRSAEVNMAQLRRQGVSEMSIRPDNAISLGVFSTEDAARRYLASLEARGVKGAESGPFVRELRDLVMLVRDPDTELVARLTIIQRDFPGSQLRAVSCPQ